MTHSIDFNIAKVRELIRAAEKKYQRAEGSVTLIAASKTQSAARIRQAAASGLRDFGENYLQEAIEKQQELGDLDLQWHFIGPIQSNKTRLIAENFDWVHSVDRLKIAQRLNDQRPIELPPLNICLQINISGEASKAGLAPEQLSATAQQLADLPRIRLRGLMAIPEPCSDEAEQRLPFRAMRELADSLGQQCPHLDQLSMGMSADLDAAIAEGATMVRIGTAIFGARR